MITGWDLVALAGGDRTSAARSPADYVAGLDVVPMECLEIAKGQVIDPSGSASILQSRR